MIKSDRSLQVFFILSLFFALTQGAFFAGWELMKACGDLIQFLSLFFLGAVGFLAYGRYKRDPTSFFSLEPIHSLSSILARESILPILLLFGIYYLTQLVNQITMHLALETALWDLAFYDQVIWNTAHADFMITSVRGGLHIFAEHFKPILALLAPFYWIKDHVYLLFAFTTFITSSTLIAVYLISGQVLRSHTTSLVLVLCVFFYSPLRNGISFLYHTQTLADPFLLFGLFFIVTSRTVLGLFFFTMALLCKENITMDVLGIGLFLTARGEKKGLAVTALALSFLAFILFYIEPRFHFPYHFVNKWNFYAHFFAPTWERWLKLLEPNPLTFLFLIFAPFLFLTFRCKGWVWLLGPSLAIRLLSAWPGFREIIYHYTAGLNALIFISVIYGLADIKQAHSQDEKTLPLFLQAKFLNVLLLLSALVFAGRSQLFKIDKYLWWASAPEIQRSVRILETIPSHFSVLTSERFSPHVSHRSHLYVFFNMFPHTPYEKAAEYPDLVIADEGTAHDRDRKAMQDFEEKGYRLIFETMPLKIYERPSKEALIPQSLKEQWTETVRAPVIDYRGLVTFTYRVSAGLAGMALLCLIAVRRNLPEAKVG